MYWIWGVAGAFVFGVNAFIFAMWNESAPARRSEAACVFFATLVTGAIFAQGYSEAAQPWVSRWIKADGVSVALTIGWMSNYLWPKILRKLGERIDRAPTEEPGT